MQQRDAETVVRAIGDQQSSNFVKAFPVAVVESFHRRQINVGQDRIVCLGVSPDIDHAKPPFVERRQDHR